jgi:hypothetical protein
MSCGVMVAQMFLVHLVEVQILAGQPFYLTQNFTNTLLTYFKKTLDTNP